MRMSDVIASFIQDMIKEEGQAQLKRNELAQKFNVVPSQINYVITSRFTKEQGYIVESRRGGGGYIKIMRVNGNDSINIMHIVNSIGNKIDKHTADIFLNNLIEYAVISKTDARLIKSAISDSSIALVPKEVKDNVRSDIFKNMLITLGL